MVWTQAFRLLIRGSGVRVPPAAPGVSAGQRVSRKRRQRLAIDGAFQENDIDVSRVLVRVRYMVDTSGSVGTRQSLDAGSVPARR